MSMPGEHYLKSLLKRVITIIVTWNVLVLCFVGTIIVLVAIFSLLALASGEEEMSSYTVVHGDGQNQLLSLKVNGIIVGTDAGSSSFFGGLDGQTAGYTVKDQLYTAASDDTIQGVILEIDSPGGTIYGSRAIADGVKYYKEKTGNPVYAHISGSGASGAYWAAISADKVIVDHGSDVGSVGIIMGPFQYYNKVLAEDGGILAGGVITEGGVESVTFTAGKSKDVGNPYRRLTPEEVAVLQKTVNNEYDGFVSYVSERRDIPDPVLRGQIGALTYDPKTALELKLVDAIGSRQDAYDKLAEAAKVKDDYMVIEEEYLPGLVESLLSAVKRQPQPKATKVDLCGLDRASLAYHGDVTTWCKD
ncbi:MAG TPA: S49 family peptidase [Candidatus Saccharimonadales bacterium]|nr:S49 family peptidase [Candidatus Saccharimonadales bacterium]